MKNRSVVVTLGIAASLLLVACTETPSWPPAQQVTQQAQPNEQSLTPSVLTPLVPLATKPVELGSARWVRGEAPHTLLDDIVADAAERSGLDRAALVLSQDQAVVWPDGSLGCPQPGMMYTQALVEGYHILIQAGEDVLDYRATQRGSFVLCEHALRLPPAQTPTQ